jgi:alkanesulfonate monooxygenase SsuD/methylene tetrahydromethanopterin reductase-like flavin-dependent oxidoreductase (luciferase family)
MNVVASRTDTLRIRFMSAVISVNHPIRIVERLATLDVMSRGRAELGLARSNNPYTLSAFGVSPSETRARLDDGVRLILHAMRTGSFEWDGNVWTVPDRVVTPPLVQDPHPPVLLSATSDTTHRFAGQMGLGVMSGNTVLGWDYLADNVRTYRDAVAERGPSAGAVDSIGTFVATAHCAPTMEEARREAEAVAYSFMDTTMDIYTRLAAQSPDYEYLGQIEALRERSHDLDFLMDFNPYFHIGTPEFLVERFERLRDIGLDEVILRIDGMGHEANMRAIDLIGSDVIPHFQGS